MRVVHVSPASFGGAGLFGGGERYPTELARAMAVHVETRLVTFGETASASEHAGVDVRVLAVRGHWRGSEVNPLSEQLVPALWDADVIHVHQWDSVVANACVLLARSRRRPVFATDHGGSGRNYWRRLHLDRLLTGFLPVSEFGASFYPELALKSAVIYGGVDDNVYRPSANAVRRGVVAVGRLLPHKGVDLLIEGLPEGVPLAVIGRPYDPAYRKLLGELAIGKDVTFVEDASDDEVIAALGSAKVAALVSQYEPTGAARAAKPELLGLALLEAMSCGTPVLCTAVGGMPEIVTDGVTGRIVPPRDPAAIGAAITELADPEADAEWQLMAKQARAEVEQRFTWDAVARRCLDAYRWGARR